jgi:hypothetical protein
MSILSLRSSLGWDFINQLLEDYWGVGIAFLQFYLLDL